MKNANKNPSVSLGTAYTVIDAVTAAIVKHENAKSPYSTGYAYCTGFFGAVLADAITKLPAKDGLEVIEKLTRRIKEMENAG